MAAIGKNFLLLFRKKVTCVSSWPQALYVLEKDLEFLTLLLLLL